MKNAVAIAKALRMAVEPFVRELADDLTKIAAEVIAEQLAVAHKHAVAKMREQLKGATDDERPGNGDAAREDLPPKKRRRKQRVHRRVRGEQPHRVDLEGDRKGAKAEPEAAAAPAVKKSRAKMACGNCGEVGYRADGCGRTHNVSTEPTGASIASRDRGNLTMPPAPSTPPHQWPAGSVLADRSRCPRPRGTAMTIGARSIASSPIWRCPTEA